jgi:predicted molibdopterin-dependent oxidoreductase YjgC
LVAALPLKTQVNKQLNVEVNGIEIGCGTDARVLDAVREAGFDVPTLCYDERIGPQGTCRLCLVEVEVDGQKQKVAACTAFVSDGMSVATHSDEIAEYRKTILEMLLSETSSPVNCPKCVSFMKCELHVATEEYGAKWDAFPALPTREKAIDDNPFIQRDYDLCISCFRCTSICNDWEQAGAIAVKGRGQENTIASYFNNNLLESPCTFCGQCINTCPTGALTDKKIVGTVKAENLERTKTICPYCGVGCGINLLSEHGELKGTEPDFDAPSRGSLCVKGQFASWEFVKSEERLKFPLIKENGTFRRASWDEALDLVTSRLTAIRDESGPDSLVCWSSARSVTEANYLMQKFTRIGIGTNNIDNCSRT